MRQASTKTPTSCRHRRINADPRGDGGTDHWLFFIAEAITPNGDGYNDEWIVGGLEYFLAAEVRVFNRWGQQVFYSQGYQELGRSIQQRAIAHG